MTKLHRQSYCSRQKSHDNACNMGTRVVVGVADADAETAVTGWQQDRAPFSRWVTLFGAWGKAFSTQHGTIIALD
jgi:hypothetical protein